MNDGERADASIPSADADGQAKSAGDRDGSSASRTDGGEPGDGGRGSSHGESGDGTDPSDQKCDAVRSDGGVAARGESTEYLDAEVNIFDPSTPFMRDHLRIIWRGFAVWVLIVFGPVTLTAIAPEAMRTQLPLIGFPLHYFLVAIGAPVGALLLAFWYARRRDQLDEEYGIDHTTTAGGPGGGGSEDAAATDGGRATDGREAGESGSGSAETRADGGERE